MLESAAVQPAGLPVAAVGEPGLPVVVPVDLLEAVLGQMLEEVLVLDDVLEAEQIPEHAEQGRQRIGALAANSPVHVEASAQDKRVHHMVPWAAAAGSRVVLRFAVQRQREQIVEATNF